MSDIKIISSGIQTTIQDLGRYGYRSHGIPLSGAMDQSAAGLANLLVGNEESDAILECTMLGPKINFSSESYIAITGAEVDVFIDGIKQKMNTTLAIASGSQLKFGKVHQGCRFYISFAGGINTVSILGSRSSDTISGIGHSILKNNDLVSLFQAREKRLFIQMNPLSDNLTTRKIRVSPGPEYHLIQEIELDKINFKINTASNRMAYLLQSNFDITHSYEMISSGVLPGTVQLTPSGQFNILMRDAQTTGGYPRILQVDEKDLDYLGQRRGGEKVEFILNFDL